MSSGCLPDAAPCDPPASDWPARDGCLALLSTLIEHMPGGARGTAVFLLDCCGPRPGDAVIAEVERRLRAASPGWHRLLQGDAGEFVVIAQGLVDGGAVLAAAARLVHAFDDALQTSNLALCPPSSTLQAYFCAGGLGADHKNQPLTDALKSIFDISCSANVAFICSS